MRELGRVQAEVMRREGTGSRGGVKGEWGCCVSERIHRTPSVVKNLGNTLFSFPKRHQIKDSPGGSEQRCRMVEELLLLLRCHYAASGDPAKLSLLSKDVGTQRGTVLLLPV